MLARGEEGPHDLSDAQHYYGTIIRNPNGPRSDPEKFIQQKVPRLSALPLSRLQRCSFKLLYVNTFYDDAVHV
jgi:hypothetical protein